MNLWQRIVFSVLSLVSGWFAFDFVLLALRYMHITETDLNTGVLLRFLWGCGILIIFLLFLTIYFLIIRRLSGNLNIIEYEKAGDKPKFKNKWFDIILQGGFLATGFFLKFFFLLVFYLPHVTK